MKRTHIPNKKTPRLLEVKQEPGEGLAGRFMFPPFSVLRATDGDWQRRKRQWLSLGIQSEVGRGENLQEMASTALGGSLDNYRKSKKRLTFGNMKEIDERGGGTSVFDPVLCELMYAWFCPSKGTVVDPFAGGSVRGVVATFMGYKYWGCELRPEQVQANRGQAKEITPGKEPTWVIGDSSQKLQKAPKADFIFTCPPYGNLETYSELEGDISNMGYDRFLESYQEIIAKSCRRLKENRFACFVVGNFRDKKTGFYYDLVGDTVRAFEQNGVHYYNECILVTAAGSLPVRVGRQFTSGRKLGKTHQNVLIFYKGDPGNIKETFNNG